MAVSFKEQFSAKSALVISLIYLFKAYFLMHKPFCDIINSPEKCLEKLVLISKEGNSKADTRLVERAFFVSMAAHEGQFRISGEPYFLHPLETAAILAGLGLSSRIVAAGLLHDVLEDTPVKAAYLKRLFGKEVLSLVEGVTKLDLLASESRKHDNFRNIYGLLLATTKDPRVILIKLADKLHNLRTLGCLPKKDRIRIANEALDIYVPIADKIGVEEISSELKDLAFREAEPETFRRFGVKVRVLSKEKEKEINLMIAILKKKLKGVVFYKKRTSLFGIYSKMESTGKGLNEINDSVILVVVAKNTAACYSALGEIHSVFPPLPNKVKDFIASPKPNLYRVLQTTVFGPKKKPVKIRLVTSEMDEINRNGVIAWRNLFGEELSPSMKQTLSKLETLLKNGNHGGLIGLLKTNFLGKPIFVFNSKGRLFELPAKSTVLDFAFVSDKNWAMHLLRAKVNGKISSFGKKLESGQIVELFYSKKPRASKKWLNLAKSFLAKEAIKKALKSRAGTKH